MGNIITRPSLVGRMLAAAYPDGVPADQVLNVPRLAAVLDLVAESVATGRPFKGIPLTLLADTSQPADFGTAKPIESKPARIEYGSVVGSVMDAMKAGEASVKSIERSTGIPYHTVYCTARRLAAEGRLRLVKAGVYALPTEEADHG